MAKENKVCVVPHPMYQSRKSLRRWYRKVANYIPENFMDRPYVNTTRQWLASQSSLARPIRFLEVVIEEQIAA